MMKLQTMLVGLGFLHIVVGFGSQQYPGRFSRSGVSSSEDTDRHIRVCFQMLEQLEIRQRLPGGQWDPMPVRRRCFSERRHPTRLTSIQQLLLIIASRSCSNAFTLSVRLLNSV